MGHTRAVFFRGSARFSSRGVPGMLALFSSRRRVLVAFAILTAVLAVSLLFMFNII